MSFSFSALSRIMIGRSTVKACNFVGTVGVPGYTIEILPKIDLDDDRTRARLLDMLALAGLVPFSPGGVAPQSGVGMTLIDAFLWLYMQRLRSEWRRGRILDYLRIAKNRSFLKGKLDFPVHLRRNLIQKQFLFTRAEEFVADVPISRVLRTALEICWRQCLADRTRRDAATLLGEFEGISEIRSRQEAARLETDRRTERFAPVLELAKLLIESSHPDRTGKRSTFCLVFDMNVVFERFIGNMFRRIAKPPLEKIHLQMTGRSLFLKGGRQVFRLKPDIGIKQRNRLVAIVDTKWKLLDPLKPHHGVKQSDMYQAYAYGKEYGADLVILLYPRATEAAPPVLRFRQHPGGLDCPCVEVVTVDVTQPSHGPGDGSVRAQCERLLGGAGTGLSYSPAQAVPS